MKPLYNGGVIQNSEFNSGLMGWSTFRNIKAGVSSSPSGNKFAVVHGAGSYLSSSGKLLPSHSVYQRVQMTGDMHYSLSAWLQVSNGTAHVRAVIKAPNGERVVAGSVIAQSGCWTMLKGGMTAYSTGHGEIYFESDAPVDISVDSVSLQPFTFDEWDAHARLSANKTRRSTIRLVAKGADDKPMAHANVSIDLLRLGFPFGNAITKEILDLPAYEKWFSTRFTVATFENEMKWYGTEWNQNQEDYRVPDAMLKLVQKYGIKVRGHNVFWDDQNSQMKWVTPMSLPQLKAAMQKRLKSVVSRYAGKVIHWDVVNENLHFSFFENKLGPTASAQIYQQVGQIDHSAILFMNEFNTLEQPGDPNPVPSKYVAKMTQIRSYPGNGGLKLGVGLESHFATPNLPYMRSALDTLAKLKMPMWLTEVDVVKSPNQVKFLEQVLREGFSHPNVDGIVMWAAWHAKGCYVMCLTDNNFKNLPVGDLVDKLIAEWKTHRASATTDDDGAVELDLPLGEYKFTVTHPSLKGPAVHTMTVDTSSSASEHIIDIKS
ncbi:endo-1,4-beta-xylanase A-like [Panicum miliaceum]|uniref:Endo-1,4-beta-xylanase A-like n=1 Tax=Panicum miliaceum TaxID=4540 RepID=A0A3L6TIR5_PANMI|nr:endo-1,4-beta-xylanase A-like [Panicum miliaceum]